MVFRYFAPVLTVHKFVQLSKGRAHQNNYYANTEKSQKSYGSTMGMLLKPRCQSRDGSNFVSVVWNQQRQFIPCFISWRWKLASHNLSSHHLVSSPYLHLFVYFQSFCRTFKTSRRLQKLSIRSIFVWLIS